MSERNDGALTIQGTHRQRFEQEVLIRSADPAVGSHPQLPQSARHGVRARPDERVEIVESGSQLLLVVQVPSDMLDLEGEINEINEGRLQPVPTDLRGCRPFRIVGQGSSPAQCLGRVYPAILSGCYGRHRVNRMTGRTGKTVVGKAARR